MNAKQMFWIFIGLGAVLAGGWAYSRFLTMPTTKEDAIRIIASFTGLDRSKYEGFGQGYLIARATAIRQGSATFKYENKLYVTKTGKADQTGGSGGGW